MAKLFIGIALLVMLATAALSFLAKGNIDKLQSSLKESKGQLAAADGKVAAAKRDAEAAKKELAEGAATKEEAVKSLETAKADAEKAKSEASQAKNALDDKEKKIAELEKQIAETPKTAAAPQGEDPQVAALTAQLKEAQAQVAEQKQLNESLAARSKEAERKASEIEAKERQYHVGATRAGLQGRILAFNPGWNFVVLSVGDKQGVMVNSPLLVLRGNTPVARLRITSVEPSTSIADVIPGSVAKGISVQPGDTVVFEGRSSTTAAPKSTNSDANSVSPALPN